MPEAEWNDERTKIICELFAEQVRAGNRPNTHLNNIGYRQAASKFQQRTQLLYTKLQLKNKWDKLKSEYTTWNKLLAMRAGLPWDNARGTIAADDDWWKKKIKELPGARKFRNGGLQNMDKLKVMFDYITSYGVDHSPPATNGFPPAPESPMNGVDHSPLATRGLPSALESPMTSVDHSPLASDGLPSDSDPDSPMDGVDHSSLAADGLPSAPVNLVSGVNLDGSGHNNEHNGSTHPERDSFQPTRNKRKPVHVKATRKNKKSKIETALLMQAHLDRIAELAQKAQATFKKFCS
uniref:Myb/SANT-like domain-containing protein n=1 Tax=Arundo donax TaxID=35708 RepID=A0A0A9BFJ6_ARUDO